MSTRATTQITKATPKEMPRKSTRIRTVKRFYDDDISDKSPQPSTSKASGYKNADKNRNLRRIENDNKAKLNCGVCGKAFSSTRDLENHHSGVHLKLKLFKCEVADCGKYLASKSSKIRHVNIVRHHIKPHRCSTCQNDFSTKSQLVSHTARSHEKIRYICNMPACTKSYSDSSNLRRHIKQKHMNHEN